MTALSARWLLRRSRSAIAFACIVAIGVGALPTAARAANRPLTVSGYVRTVPLPSPGESLAVGAPVSGASVSGGVLPATTDADGYYELTVPGFGTYTITANKAPEMRPETAVVTISASTTSATQDFTLLYQSTASLNNAAFNVSSAAFVLTNTLTSYAPSSACAYVSDSRTGTKTAMTVGGTASGLTTWTWSATVPQGTADGTHTLTSDVEWCGGDQIDVGTIKPYVIDGTSPLIANLVPAADGTTTDPTPTITAQVLESGSGVDPASAVLAIDGTAVAASAYTLEARPTGTVLVYNPSTALGGGDHIATLSVSDKAGNTATAIEWTFVIATLTSLAQTVELDPASRATVPLVVTPNQLLPVATSINTTTTSLALDFAGHSGFGVVCGSVNLAALRAKFTTLNGTQYVAPTGLAPATRYACAYVSVLEPDDTRSFELLISGQTLSVGNLNFAVPTGTTPNSPVTLEFRPTAPTLNFTETCFTSEAAPGMTPGLPVTTCDPLANLIDGAIGKQMSKDLDSRALDWLGYAQASRTVVPSVWTNAGQRVSTPLDTTKLHTTQPIATTLTSQTRYGRQPASGESVFYQEVRRFVNQPTTGGLDVVIDSYFRRPSALQWPGRSYLATSWADGTTAAAPTWRLLGEDGVTSAPAVDDSSASTAGLATSEAAFGYVLRIDPQPAVNGQAAPVLAGWLTEQFHQATPCLYCRDVVQWVQTASSGTQTFTPQAGGGFLASGIAPDRQLAAPSTNAKCNNDPVHPLPGVTSVSSTRQAPNCAPKVPASAPAQTHQWYITFNVAQSSYPTSSTKRKNCPDHMDGSPVNPLQWNPDLCDIPYSLGYADTSNHATGAEILGIGRPCNGTETSFFTSNICKGFSDVARWVAESYLDGFYAQPAALATSRQTQVHAGSQLRQSDRHAEPLRISHASQRHQLLRSGVQQPKAVRRAIQRPADANAPVRGLRRRIRGRSGCPGSARG